jgi:GNAT superfamily N-acetyltransferase
MDDRADAGDWRLVRYREGDEKDILALFTNVFHRPRSREHWQWQFRDNPYGGPFATTARRTSDDAVIGIYSVTPMRLNYVGRPVPACQSVDTAVHPDHRGQRIFERTASDCYAWAASTGIEAIIGFPNSISYPGLVRTLGWKRVLFPTQYKMRLRIGDELGRRTGVSFMPAIVDAARGHWIRRWLALRHSAFARLAGPGIRYSESASVPPGYEALWNVWRAQEVISVWKDTEYLTWRYDGNPDHRFTYHSLERAGELVAMAITVEIGLASSVCEFFVRGRDVALGRLLASELCRHAIAHDRTAVSFLAHDAGFFEDAFEGFARRRSYANVLCALAFREGPLAEDLPHANQWTITFGDGDFV